VAPCLLIPSRATFRRPLYSLRGTRRRAVSLARPFTRLRTPLHALNLSRARVRHWRTQRHAAYLDQHVPRAFIEHVADDLLTRTPPCLLRRLEHRAAGRGASIEARSWSIWRHFLASPSSDSRPRPAAWKSCSSLRAPPCYHRPRRGGLVHHSDQGSQPRLNRSWQRGCC
jgi:hypothetical protein